MQRFNFIKYARTAYRALVDLDAFVQGSILEAALVDLIKLRVSQINGCAYCIDIHAKDLRARGDTEQRVYGLSAWREVDYYTPRERAALLWAESVTLLDRGHVPDDVYAEVSAQFDEAAISVLTFAVVSINAWNRIAIPSRLPAGEYVSKIKI